MPSPLTIDGGVVRVLFGSVWRDCRAISHPGGAGGSAQDGAGMIEEDEPTTRMEAGMLLEAFPARQSPTSVLQPVPGVHEAARAPNPLSVRGPRGRDAKIGVGLFVAGIMVGVVSAAALMKSRATPAADAAPTRAPILTPGATAQPTSVLAPETAKPREVTTPPAVVSADPPPAVVTPPPARRAALPVSIARAPTCQELLGDAPVQHQNAKAASRETRLANRQLQLGNVPMAQAAYCHAFTLDRANVDRHVNLARLYLVRRDWTKAAELARSGLALAANDRRALAVLGDALAALNELDEARSTWLAAEGKPRASERELHLMAKRNLALAQRVSRLNDFSLAERLYRRVLLVDAQNAEAMKGIASCLLKVGDYSAAAAWARQANQAKQRL